MMTYQIFNWNQFMMFGQYVKIEHCEIWTSWQVYTVTSHCTLGYVKIGLDLEINRIELNKFERCSEVRWLLWISCELQHFGDKFENMYTTRFVGKCTILRNDHVLMLSVIDPLYIAVAFIVNLKRFLLWFGFIYETQSQICNS